MAEQFPDQMPLKYQGETLYMDGVALEAIADAVGTPAYVYSADDIRDRVKRLREAFAGQDCHIHYSVKANGNLAVLRLFKELGCGFDIVSGGELTRVMAAGGTPDQVVFSGVGKQTAEIDYALKLGIGCFNVESAGELERLGARAELLGVTAPLALRVNPNVDPQTHPYISTGLKQNKFGVAAEEALHLYERAQAHEHLAPIGLDCHIGSQIASPEPLLQAMTSMLELTDALTARGIKLEHLDLGGGMGVIYAEEEAFDTDAYGASVAQLMGKRNLAVYLEPGRSLVANAGVLLTRVEYLKPGDDERPNFAVVDAGMNDLIRPALYEAWHGIHAAHLSSDEPAAWDVVGPVCESGDFLGRNRQLVIQEGDLLTVTSCGAYGLVQASNYNARPRPCEVLVDGDQFRVVRRRETIEDQLRLEQAL